jgi:hypothetical protein
MDIASTELRNMVIIYSSSETMAARLSPTLEAVKNNRHHRQPQA